MITIGSLANVQQQIELGRGRIGMEMKSCSNESG
jgi:hypothetical protein